MIANDARDTQIASHNYALGGIESETGDVIVMHEAGPATGADATPDRSGHRSKCRNQAHLLRDQASQGNAWP